MRVHTGTSVFLAALLIALFASAPQVWGFKIEGQTTETVTNVWDLLSDSLDVGHLTSGNAMIVTSGGQVQNNTVGTIGHDTFANDNTVVVIGAGSAWNNTSLLYVGNKGIGNALTVTAGGFVQNTSGFIGYESSAANNTVDVIGAGSVWSNSSLLVVGRKGSGNALTITDGGRVENTVGTIGFTNAHNNTVTVSGEGSVWRNNSPLTESLTVGRYGSGNALFIADGGRVENARGVVGSESNASNNMVSVSGAGALWSNAASLYVGRHGNGTMLSITGGGRVQDANGVLGRYSSNNTADVSGAGSVWNSVNIYVGWDGIGNMLSITGGGRVENTADGFIGYDSGATGNTVAVSGAGSVWSNAAALYAGFNGNGNALSITDGGLVRNTGDGFIGFNGDAFGNTVSVSGTGSVWSNSAVLNVGFDGGGNTLSITGGGRVENGVGYIGSNSSDNTVIVSGTGSLWRNSPLLHENFYVGYAGSGNALSITDGGRVECRQGVIGNLSDAFNNIVSVSGTNSVWSNASVLYVGGEGSGNVLSITEGGRVESLIGTIGYDSGAGSNTVEVIGAGSLWTNSGSLHVGGYASDKTGDRLDVVNRGRVVASVATLYPTNTIQLLSGGILEISDDFTIEAGAMLKMGISSDAGSNYGHLSVGGLASLDGILEVVLGDGYVPDSGAVFDLFNWNSVGGGFAEVNLPALPFGLLWITTNLYTTGELSVGYSTADTDSDGMADGWEHEHFWADVLPTDNPDLDSHNNLSEYIAGTHPDDKDSYFCITHAAPTLPGFMIEWEPCVSNRWYTVLWTKDLGTGFTSLVSIIEFPQNSYTNTLNSADGTGYYQVDVRMK